MSSIYNENIQGNLSTSRDITVGGHLNVHANSVFDHNVVIKGWLDAKNIKGPCKGLYASEEALNEAYPKPMPGWYALVGDTLPAAVYRAEGGKWVATGEQGGEVNLYLDQLENDVADLGDDVADIQELIGNGLLVPGSVAFSSTATTVTLTYKVRKSDGTETPYNVTVPIVTAEKAGMMSASDKKKIIELDAAVWPVTVAMTASPSIVEAGVSTEVALTWSVKRKGKEVSAYSTMKLDGTTVTGMTKKLTVNESSAKTISHTLSATYEDITGSATTKITVVLPMYFGFAAANAASGLQITSLGKQPLKTSPAGTYTLTNNTDGNYMWLCVPSTMTINKVTLNGFDVPMEAAQDAGTNLGDYKCYRSSNALVAQDFTFVIS